MSRIGIMVWVVMAVGEKANRGFIDWKYKNLWGIPMNEGLSGT